jgi:hypothetical protein
MRRGSIRFETLRFDIFYISLHFLSIEDTFACMSVYSIIRCRAIDSAQELLRRRHRPRMLCMGVCVHTVQHIKGII